MSVRASISLGTSVLIVSTKPDNVPGQAILQKKNHIKKFYLLLGDGWQTSRVSVQEWS